MQEVKKLISNTSSATLKDERETGRTISPYLDIFFVIPIFKPVLMIGRLPTPTPLSGIFI